MRHAHEQGTGNASTEQGEGESSEQKEKTEEETGGPQTGAELSSLRTILSVR